MMKPEEFNRRRLQSRAEFLTAMAGVYYGEGQPLVAEVFVRIEQETQAELAALPPRKPTPAELFLYIGRKMIGPLRKTSIE